MIFSKYFYFYNKDKCIGICSFTFGKGRIHGFEMQTEFTDRALINAGFLCSSTLCHCGFLQKLSHAIPYCQPGTEDDPGLTWSISVKSESSLSSFITLIATAPSYTPTLSCLVWFDFKTGSHRVVPAGLQLIILLLVPPQRRTYMHTSILPSV